MGCVSPPVFTYCLRPANFTMDHSDLLTMTFVDTFIIKTEVITFNTAGRK